MVSNPRLGVDQNSQTCGPLPLSERDAARYVNMSAAFLRKCRARGNGPTATRLGRSVRYLQRDLDEWLDRHRVVARERDSRR